MRKRIGNPNVIFMNATLVAKIAKNKLEEIRISVLKNNKVDVRTYFYFPQEQEPKPTKKGIMLSYKYFSRILTELEKLTKDPAYGFDVVLEETEKEQIKFYSGEYLGTKLIHIRSFYPKEGKFMPGKGIAFSAALSPQILEALKQAEAIKD